MITFDEAMAKLDANIKEAEEDREVWQQRLELARARVEICEKALCSCDAVLMKYHDIKVEMLLGFPNHTN